MDWQALAKQAAACPTLLAKIFHRDPTYLGFCDASSIGTGGVWIDPAKLGTSIVWRHPRPSDITDTLVP